MAVLRGVIDPELGSDIVDLGMAKKATVDADGAVTITIALTSMGCPLRAQIKNDAAARVNALVGVTGVTIDRTELTAEEKAETMSIARRVAADQAKETAIPAGARVLAIASGKGWVENRQSRSTSPRRGTERGSRPLRTATPKDQGWALATPTARHVRCARCRL